MQNLEVLLEPIRHSPCLVEAVDMLKEQIDQERERRAQFYRDMTPEEKVEFIDGEVVMHSPARKVHLDVAARLLQLLRLYVISRKLGHVFSEKCLCVFPRNDYEPDIVFFGPERGAQLTAATLKFPVPDFAVEILSDSTQERDRGVKFEDYAAHGVGEYWIVDPDSERIEQYLLNQGRYELMTPSADGQIVSRVIPGFSMPQEAAFRDEANVGALRTLVL